MDLSGRDSSNRDDGKPSLTENVDGNNASSQRLKKRGSQHTLPADSDNIDLVLDSLLRNGHFPVITSLLNLRPHGARFQWFVNGVLQTQSEYYDLLEHLSQTRRRILLASNRAEKATWQTAAVQLLRKYYLLLALAIYLYDTQPSIVSASLTPGASSLTPLPGEEDLLSFSSWFGQTPSIASLFSSITAHHIDQYLSIVTPDAMTGSVRQVDGFINVHTLLLLQQVCDQNNRVISKSLLLEPSTHHTLFGTVFTKQLVCVLPFPDV